ncbi:HAMP domain-containing protein [Paenibacillus campinasensis]|uniref:HAMP domain-containing protein n=1 Tax=Paenibacillus campinasensis TaxID=66347 RepID=A0ABW9SZ22_9BACL|nr:methyl-accepting chemotaxis protein [Paenibacillus campinasensis]MUG66265.1 HAMP domain-containing protein [Paenibacillus campinasensis]
MKIRTKMVISSSLLTLATAVIVFIAFVSSYSTEQNFNEIIDVDEQIIYNLTQIEKNLEGIANNERGFLLTGDFAYTEDLNVKRSEINSLLTSTRELMSEESDLEMLSEIESGFEEYEQAVMTVLNKLGYDTGFYKAVPFRVYEESYKQEQSIRSAFASLIANFTEEKNQELNQRINQTMSSSSWNRSAMLLFGVIAVGYYIVQAYLLIRSIRPLNTMKDQLLKIAEGGGDLVTRLNITTKDEIRDIADAYNKLVEGFRNIVMQVQQTAEKVGESAAQLKSSTVEIRQASQQTAGIMEELAAGVENQLADTEQTTTTATDMSEGMKYIAETAKDVSSLASRTNQLASDGEQAILQTLNQMDDIRSSVDESAQSVRSLGEKATNISSIGQIIIEIAEQTSLLAMNASIEAARAGEHGRGFAVVASEVRKLAEQASNSSIEIKQFVQELQQDIYELANVMENGTHKVTEGMSVAQGAERAFKDIEQSIVQLNEQIYGVTAATDEMNYGVEELVQAIRRIQEVTETTAGGTQSVSAATEEQLASMEEISMSVEELNEMSGRLRQLMSGFKV